MILTISVRVRSNSSLETLHLLRTEVDITHTALSLKDIEGGGMVPDKYLSSQEVGVMDMDTKWTPGSGYTWYWGGGRCLLSRGSIHLHYSCLFSVNKYLKCGQLQAINLTTSTTEDDVFMGVNWSLPLWWCP